eukprot:GILJ01012852.1.p1 GENE.GILJ01012852.1~~GILJ01012852.1.p1  ORF type:complete len:398 (-),score=50.15 GILJ01012852.1:41-1093(-)
MTDQPAEDGLCRLLDGIIMPSSLLTTSLSFLETADLCRIQCSSKLLSDTISSNSSLWRQILFSSRKKKLKGVTERASCLFHMRHSIKRAVYRIMSLNERFPQPVFNIYPPVKIKHLQALATEFQQNSHTDEQHSARCVPFSIYHPVDKEDRYDPFHAEVVSSKLLSALHADLDMGDMFDFLRVCDGISEGDNIMDPAWITIFGCFCHTEGTDEYKIHRVPDNSNLVCFSLLSYPSPTSSMHIYDPNTGVVFYHVADEHEIFFLAPTLYEYLNRIGDKLEGLLTTGGRLISADAEEEGAYWLQHEDGVNTSTPSESDIKPIQPMTYEEQQALLGKKYPAFEVLRRTFVRQI